MASTNERLEALLTEWAELLAVSGADAFRVRAYERAARALGGHGTDVAGLSDKEILAIPSVGKNMLGRIREFLDAGSVRELDDLREQVPAGMRDLLHVPGLGPKKAMILHRELGISTVDDLARAIEQHALRDIKGLGAKTEENLARSMKTVREHGGRILLDAATETAEDVIDALRAAGAERITYAGSLRRMRDTIGDVDILVAHADPDAIMAAFVASGRAAQTLAHGTTKSSIVTTEGLQVDLRVVADEEWGAALLYFTGSKGHNIALRHRAIQRGMKLSEWGLFEAESGVRIAAATEEDVYAALELPYIPPTLREDTGEIEAAEAGTLPTVVSLDDITGDLHSHTDMTDGVASLDEMLEAASKRGYRFYAVTDHAEGLSMAGAGRDQMLEQRARLREAQARYPAMRLLHGTELNIGRDGTVDYDAEFLAGFDVCVASIHSSFRLSEAETTRRLIAAMENPNVHVIGHPSARLIGRRDPVAWDFDAVCAAAVRTGTALEVNCFPDRIDLRDEYVRRAVAAGVTLSIDTDAHTQRDLMNLRYGVGTAQRGWATPANVLNTRTADEVLAFVAAKRAR